MFDELGLHLEHIYSIISSSYHTFCWVWWLIPVIQTTGGQGKKFDEAIDDGVIDEDYNLIPVVTVLVISCFRAFPANQNFENLIINHTYLG